MLHDGKLSLMLRRLRLLNNGSCNDTVVRTIFLDHLSATHRAVLAASRAEDLDGLAEAADRLADSVDMDGVQIYAVNKGLNVTPSLEDEIRRLISEVANINKKINRLDQKINQSRAHSASRRRSLLRPRFDESSTLCGAHRTYPDNPTMGQEWCSKYASWFQQNN